MTIGKEETWGSPRSAFPAIRTLTHNVRRCRPNTAHDNPRYYTYLRGEKYRLYAVGHLVLLLCNTLNTQLEQQTWLVHFETLNKTRYPCPRMVRMVRMERMRRARYQHKRAGQSEAADEAINNSLLRYNQHNLSLSMLTQNWKTATEMSPNFVTHRDSNND